MRVSFARYRDQLRARGASQPAGRGQEEKTFTPKELQVLDHYDDGNLLEDLNMQSLRWDKAA